MKIRIIFVVFFSLQSFVVQGDEIMRTFQQNKLWRDKMIDKAEDNGSKIHWARLDDAAFATELKTKMMEEAAEVCSAKTKDELIAECADVLEVLKAFGQTYDFTLQDVLNVQEKKYQDRGGFEGRKFVTVAQHPVNSYLEQYCLNDPLKYPEIKY